MKVTIAKVEKLMDRADVGYEVAKEALEAADGSLLDAIIALEQQGKFGPNAGAKAYVYSTGSNVPATVVGQSYGAGTAPHEQNFTMGGDTATGKNRKSKQGGWQDAGSEHGYGNQSGASYRTGHSAYNQAGGPRMYKDESTEAEENIKRFFRWLGRVFRASLVNYFEIWRRGERIASFPVILFLFCFIQWVFWVVLAILIIGLFCGCRYRFSGPHLGKKSVNDAMDKASDMAEDIKDGEDPHH